MTELLGTSLRESTHKAYSYTVDRFTIFLDGQPPSQQHAEKFISTLRGNGNTPKSIVRHLSALRYYFKENGIPLEIPSPPIDEVLPPFITQDEFLNLVHSAQRLRLRAALCLLYGGALRLSECKNLRCVDITQDGYIKVMGKGGRERMVPVETPILDVVNMWKRKAIRRSTYLFYGEDRLHPESRKGFQMLITRHMKRCGIRGKSVHSLRHGGATSLYNKGVDLKELQDFLGHKSLATTGLYTHISPERLKESITRAGRFTSEL